MLNNVQYENEKAVRDFHRMKNILESEKMKYGVDYQLFYKHDSEGARAGVGIEYQNCFWNIVVV